jgi:NADPH:quinone reductase-like Zn-dependent oxidoreductase
MMRAVRIHTRAGPDALVVEEAPYPHTAENDVVIRVHAAGFTPGELDWPGTWKDLAGRDRCPVIPGHEVSGEVAELGMGTTGLTVGQRVFGLTDSARGGTLAEYVAVEARNLAPLPASIDHIRGAALPMPGLTAWQALFDHANLRPGQTVLVHGAGGAVGRFAVQLAKEVGARIIGTGRERDRAAVLEPGAEVLDRSAAVVRPGGTLVSVAAQPRVRPAEGRTVFFVVEPNRDQLAELARWVQQGRLTPKAGAVRPLAETRDAFLTKEGTQGKTIIQVA